MSRIILPDPHGPKQRLIMLSLVTPGLTELWVACGSKFGKSIGAAGGVAIKAMSQQNMFLRWVAPIYSQTKIGFKYCKKILPPEPHTDPNNSALSLTMPRLDSTIEFKSGKYPEDLEGEACHGYILDETAKMSEQVYNSAKTTTTVTRGSICAISTPRGKNWFYTKCMDAKQEMEWAIKKGIPPARLFLTAPSSDNPMVSKEAIAEAQRSMPDRLYRQYYLAEFVDDGSVFLGYRECMYEPELVFDTPRQRWFDETYAGGTVCVGADWAKTHDYTVFTAFDTGTRRLVAFERFNKTPYTEAIRRLYLFCKQFADIIVVRHDKTGLGNVIDDQLAYTDLPYEGVTFTNALKAEMVAQLITSIEQKMVTLPQWRELASEFESYEVTTNNIGNMSYNAIEGKHDDIISSLLLSHSALMQYCDTGMSVSFVDQLKKGEAGADKVNAAGKDTMSPVEKFYSDLLEDDYES